jgi:hypothetical protein
LKAANTANSLPKNETPEQSDSEQWQSAVNLLLIMKLQVKNYDFFNCFCRLPTAHCSMVSASDYYNRRLCCIPSNRKQIFADRFCYNARIFAGTRDMFSNMGYNNLRLVSQTKMFHSNLRLNLSGNYLCRV